MIVGDLKPIEEIAESISNYQNILVLGCGSCVTVCLSGGDREARQLAKELSHIRYFKKNSQFSVILIHFLLQKQLKLLEGIILLLYI